MNPALDSQIKLVTLRAAARAVGIPPEDLLFFALVIVQSTENASPFKHIPFTDIASQLIAAPDHIKSAIRGLIVPLRVLNEKITDAAMDEIVKEALENSPAPNELSRSSESG